MVYFAKINRHEHARIAREKIAAERSLLEQEEAEIKTREEKKERDEMIKLSFEKADEKSCLLKLRKAASELAVDGGSFTEALKDMKSLVMSASSFRDTFYRIFLVRFTLPEVGVVVHHIDPSGMVTIDGPTFYKAFLKLARVEEKVLLGELKNRQVRLDILRPGAKVPVKKVKPKLEGDPEFVLDGDSSSGEDYSSDEDVPNSNANKIGNPLEYTGTAQHRDINKHGVTHKSDMKKPEPVLPSKAKSKTVGQPVKSSLKGRNGTNKTGKTALRFNSDEEALDYNNAKFTSSTVAQNWILPSVAGVVVPSKPSEEPATTISPVSMASNRTSEPSSRISTSRSLREDKGFVAATAAQNKAQGKNNDQNMKNQSSKSVGSQGDGKGAKKEKVASRKNSEGSAALKKRSSVPVENGPEGENKEEDARKKKVQQQNEERAKKAKAQAAKKKLASASAGSMFFAPMVLNTASNSNAAPVLFSPGSTMGSTIAKPPSSADATGELGDDFLPLMEIVNPRSPSPKKNTREAPINSLLNDIIDNGQFISNTLKKSSMAAQKSAKASKAQNKKTSGFLFPALLQNLPTRDITSAELAATSGGEGPLDGVEPTPVPGSIGTMEIQSNTANPTINNIDTINSNVPTNVLLETTSPDELAVNTGNLNSTM